MVATSLQQFMSETFETRRSQGQPPEAFELVRGKSFLKVNLGAAGSDGNAPLTQVWVKGSCLVANRGQVSLTRDPNSDSGSGIMLATAAAYPAAGAHLFLASESCHIILLRLGGGPGSVESLAVNTTALLAFEPTVAHTIRRVTLGAGGVVANNTAPSVRVALLQGYGFVALLTQGPPMTVAVGPGLPHLCADPQATIAWSSNVVFPHLAPKPGFLDTAENRRKVYIYIYIKRSPPFDTLCMFIY